MPRLVALINAAFAMERAFVDRDRTSVEEISKLTSANARERRRVGRVGQVGRVG